jgi:hypothetical protein
MKGRKHSEETKIKMSIAQTGKTRRRLLKRRPPSEETRRKISLAKKGKPSTNKRSILQIDLKGNIIREWESITEAQNITGFTGVGAVLVKLQKTSGGFLWKYKEDVL